MILPTVPQAECPRAISTKTRCPKSEYLFKERCSPRPFADEKEKLSAFLRVLRGSKKVSFAPLRVLRGSKKVFFAPLRALRSSMKDVLRAPSRAFADQKEVFSAFPRVLRGQKKGVVRPPFADQKEVSLPTCLNQTNTNTTPPATNETAREQSAPPAPSNPARRAIARIHRYYRPSPAHNHPSCSLR